MKEVAGVSRGKARARQEGREGEGGREGDV